MTPQELHAAIAARKRELREPWWRIALALDISERLLFRMKRGECSPCLQERAEEWLRRQAPPS